MGIVGESGSGKTLLCKAIMRLLNKNTFKVTGKIRYNNQDILKLDEEKARKIIGSKISMLMQNPMTAFNPMLKIGNQIIETLQAHLNINKKKAYDIGITGLKKMNLKEVDGIMNSYPYSLSGGMLQRIMIALSLMVEPSVIIADEATTALDVKTQNIILGEFEKISNKNIALIIVSHDFGVIAQIADDVIVMKDGKIIEEGTVFELFDNPEKKYTKKLLEARFLKRGVK